MSFRRSSEWSGGCHTAAHYGRREVDAEWNTTLPALWLHGSEPVAAAVVSIDHEVNQLLDEALRTTVDWTVWPQLRELSLPRPEAPRVGSAVRQSPVVR